MDLPWTNREQILLVLSRNRERISGAVAQALDERGWLPDQIVVLVLRGDDPLTATVMSRLGMAQPQGEPAVTATRLEAVRKLCDALDLPPAGLDRTPEHGCVRVVLTSGDAPVLTHAQYVTAGNYEQWQRRLDAAIDRISTRIAGAREPDGPLS